MTIKEERRLVSDMINQYIERELPKKPKSYEKQKHQLTWWNNEIGHLFLKHLTAAQLAECRDKLSNELTCRGSKRSNSTVNRYLAVISHCFSIASKEWHWIDDNPAKNVQRLKEPRGRDRILQDYEIKQLIEACKQSRNPSLYPVVMIALSTGMRKGEILSLKRDNIDLSRSRIILRNTKNGEIRAVHLSPE